MSQDILITADLTATPWRFLWWDARRTAILADLHLSSNFAMPYMQTAWAELAQRKPQHVIIAGDLMDQRDPPAAAMERCREMLGKLPSDCRITLTPGNHDPENLAQLLQMEGLASLRIGPYTVSHGHVLISVKNAMWIVGHQHPAVTLQTRVQRAKMACYALAPATRNRPQLLILPAFNRDAGGPLGAHFAAASNWLLPLHKPSNFHIYGIVEPAHKPPQILDFGTLKNLLSKANV